MRRTLLPLMLGVLTAGAVAGGGLLLSAGGPSDPVGGVGAAPAQVTPLPQQAVDDPRGDWEAPALPDNLDDLEYEEKLALLLTQIDPRGAQEGAPVATITAFPDIDFGNSGWDSSRYPALPGVSTPSGAVLHRAADDPAQTGMQGRRWSYVLPEGTPLSELCAAGREALEQVEGGLSIWHDNNCEPVGRSVIIFAESDTVWANVTVTEEGMTCLDQPDPARMCPTWTVHLVYRD